MNINLHLRKYLRTYPQWRFAPPRVQVQRALQAIGSDYGGYSLDPSLIGPGAEGPASFGDFHVA